MRKSPGVSDVLLFDDALRLRALREGDEAAFLRLVADHHPGMRRLALLRTGDPARAEAAARAAWDGLLAAAHEGLTAPAAVRLVLFAALLRGLPAPGGTSPDAEVVLLRAREGWPAEDVERLLGVDEERQRVALGRGRLALAGGRAA